MDPTASSACSASDGMQDEALNWACAHSERCASGQSCVRKGQCHEGPMCTMLFTIGTTAGVVLPGAGAMKCGYYAPSIYGAVCFCPTRVELFRRSYGLSRSTVKAVPNPIDAPRSACEEAVA